MKFTIELDPKTKKNSSRIVRIHGRPVIVPSRAYKEYIRNAFLYIPTPAPMIDYPVNVKAIYYMATRRRVDISNLHSALHDLLTEYGVLKDDNCRIIVSTDGSRVMYDKLHPRTEVEITRTEASFIG